MGNETARRYRRAVQVAWGFREECYRPETVIAGVFTIANATNSGFLLILPSGKGPLPPAQGTAG